MVVGYWIDNEVTMATKRRFVSLILHITDKISLIPNLKREKNFLSIPTLTPKRVPRSETVHKVDKVEFILRVTASDWNSKPSIRAQGSQFR